MVEREKYSTVPGNLFAERENIFGSDHVSLLFSLARTERKVLRVMIVFSR
jgi:hypothetical protein